MKSNESYIGLANGQVTRARGIARITANQRWSADRISCIAGTPGKPHGGLDDSILEGLAEPHLMEDHKDIEHLQDDDPEHDDRMLEYQWGVPKNRVPMYHLDLALAVYSVSSGARVSHTLALGFGGLNNMVGKILLQLATVGSDPESTIAQMRPAIFGGGATAISLDERFLDRCGVPR